MCLRDRAITGWAPRLTGGHECVAEVVAIGAEVRTVVVGDRVVVPFPISCGKCATCVRGLTASCTGIPARSMYGFGDVGGRAWGGVLADRVRVPFADAICTSVGIYYDRTTPIPLLGMYGNGVTFVTGRVNARAELPAALALVATGRFDPSLVTTRVAAWDDAAEAMLDRGAKVVLSREPA